MTARLTVFADAIPALLKQQTLAERVDLAEQIADEARAAAPVVSGAYRGGIGVDVAGTEVRVVDDDDRAVFKEYGTNDTPAHAALTQAAMNHGVYRGWQPRK